MLMHMQNLENAKILYELASAGDNPNKETQVLAFLILEQANQHFETWKEANPELADSIKVWEEMQEQQRLDRILDDVDQDFNEDVDKPKL